MTKFLEENHPDIMILLDDEFKQEHNVPGFVAVKWDAPLDEIVDFVHKNMFAEHERRLNVS